MLKKGILTRLQQKQFVISVQIDPPSTAIAEKFSEMMYALIRSGVSIVDINSSRRISHDSIQLAIALSQLGLEVIPHITARDSSINGLLNQILAAYAWGRVRNFLVITGDPYEASQAIIPSEGVFQTDAVGALKAFDSHLRKKTELQCDIALGAAVNQNEHDLEIEGVRVQEKENAGADFFMSQPVFDIVQARVLLDFSATYTSKPLLVGVWPLIHWRTIEIIYSSKVVGVVIPECLYTESTEIHENEEALREKGIKDTLQLIEYLRNDKRAAGVYIVAPSRNPLLILDFLKKVHAAS